MGDLQPGASALLRPLPRGGGHLCQIGSGAPVPRKHTKVSLPNHEVLLEAEALRENRVQGHPPGAGDNLQGTDAHTQTLQKPKVDTFGGGKNDASVACQIICIEDNDMISFEMANLFKAQVTPIKASKEHSIAKMHITTLLESGGDFV